MNIEVNQEKKLCDISAYSHQVREVIK